jgi:flagellar basal-body rod protein FlgB
MLDRLSENLERYMDVLALRQKVASSNIANADTPGYRTKDLDFQAAFRSAIEGGEPKASEVGGLPVKNDGNDVSLDREARLIAENAMRFSAASNLLRGHIRMIKAAIQEGRNS